MNGISRKPARTVTELASARQHQENPADHHGARGGGQNDSAASPENCPRKKKKEGYCEKSRCVSGAVVSYSPKSKPRRGGVCVWCAFSFFPRALARKKIVFGGGNEQNREFPLCE